MNLPVSTMTTAEKLAVLGGIHSKRFGCHCMPAKHFPFAIYYSMSESTVFVVAILDERRDPDWIDSRLKRG